MTRRSSALVALVLLGAALLLPNTPGALTPTAWLILPVELPVLLLLLATAPARLLGPLRIAIVVLLLAAMVLKLADLGTETAFLRPFNPVFDMELVAAGWRLASGSLGVAMASAVALGLIAALTLAAAILWWCTGALARLRPARWRPGAVAALVLPAVLAVGLAAEPTIGPPIDALTTRTLWQHAEAGWRARADLARFRAEAVHDAYTALPPERILPDLRGTDVFVVFVESYGRAALDNPRYRATTVAALRSAEAELRAAGLAARSAFLRAPMVGGQSWFAHASLLSGVRIDNQGRYRALLASPRRTLLHLAGTAGWTTTAVMPAITLAWPEAGYFGYDRVLAARELGYRGRPFNWVTMPDQFTLASFERQLLAARPRPPVFAEIALISSHAPWTPIPPILPWDALGDGRVFDAHAEAGDPPEVVWQDVGRVRDQYRRSLDYVLRVVGSFAARRAPDPPLIVVLGDHQPAPFVSEDAVGREVPVHVIGTPAALAALQPWGWTPGLVPARDAPTGEMEGFRDRFLDAFGSGPVPRPVQAADLR